jgi:hypothetical protein
MQMRMRWCADGGVGEMETETEMYRVVLPLQVQLQAADALEVEVEMDAVEDYLMMTSRRVRVSRKNK